MRIFLAIELPKEIKDYLFDLEKKFKEAKITWVSKKNLHVTLKFFGELKEEKVKEILTRLPKRKPFTMHLKKIGFFPNEKDPRVIWVSLEPEQEIIALQQAIDAEFLTDIKEEQKFQAHITLGRIKSIRRKKDFLDSVQTIKIEHRVFIIDSYQLISSKLSKLGPVYNTIKNVALS
ncbi:RNA 2',3'-cyclic phosphodiesterase [Candidatus Woesearchaeota archaeon]|nr:RNA 2',3'-cyclic phosphodiesterase [Candidatus Woesearchaeota archaeon]